MKTCTITIDKLDIDEPELDENGDEKETYTVSLTPNEVFDFECVECETDAEADAEAQSMKVDLENEGYEVKIVWNCMKPGWAEI